MLCCLPHMTSFLLLTSLSCMISAQQSSGEFAKMDKQFFLVSDGMPHQEDRHENSSNKVIDRFWSKSPCGFVETISFIRSIVRRMRLNHFERSLHINRRLMQGSPAEQAVKHQYLSSAEMTHRLSGYREAEHLAEWLQVSAAQHPCLAAFMCMHAHG